MRHLLTVTTLAVLATAAQAKGFVLTSPDITHGKPLKTEQVYKGFGCDGGNVAPTLAWSGAPKGTKSFAVTVYDPDAPTGSGWWNWTVVNIPADVTKLEKGQPLPAGAVQGRTDFGSSGFGGACPPVGHKKHRYHFTVWALKTDKLDLDANASGAMVGYMLNANVLGKATITATYQR